MVKEQQKQDAAPEPDDRREKRKFAQPRRLFNGRDQQTPHRCRHHDPGCKAGEGTLDAVAQGLFQKEYTACPKACAQKGDQDPPECVLYHVEPSCG